MENSIIGIIGLLAILGLMFLKIPIAYVFISVGAMGLVIMASFKPAMSIFGVLPFSWATTYSFSCLPMFILMGYIISESHVAKDLYSTAYKWLGRLPGGLAMASLVACGLFSALSGTALAAAATIGTVCYPEMRKYGYDAGLASGSIAVGATMDIMIPPSLPMIIFGMIADVSVGKMFMAGFMPGALEVILFSLAIFIMVKKKPLLAPLSTETHGFIDKLKSLKGVLPVLLVFIMVFGGLYGGMFTPTEAGACGAIASTLVTLAMGRLSRKGFLNALGKTVQVTGTIFMVIFGTMTFNTFLGLSGISHTFSRWVVETGVTPTGFIVLVLLLYLPLGALMEEISMMMLTLPFYIPAAQALGIDLIWFGILIILAWQIGLVAPPVGIIAFVTQSIVKEPTIGTVYKGCLPFIGALILVEALVIAIPDIALLLVRAMK